VRVRALDASAAWQDQGALADAIVAELAVSEPVEVGLDVDPGLPV
jgi:hypothetical protein